MKFYTGVNAGSGFQADVNNRANTVGLVVFYGPATPAAYTEAFIEALTYRSIQLSRDVAPVALNALAGQKLYWALPTAFGGESSSFIDEDTSFPVGMSKVASEVNVTDEFGVTRPYDLWESDVAGLGVIKVNVR